MTSLQLPPLPKGFELEDTEDIPKLPTGFVMEDSFSVPPQSATATQAAPPNPNAPNRSILGEMGSQFMGGVGDMLVGASGLNRMAADQIEKVTGPNAVTDAMFRVPSEFTGALGQSYQQGNPPSEGATFGARNVLGTVSRAAPQLIYQTGAALATGGASLPAQLLAFGVTGAAPVVGQQYAEGIAKHGDPDKAALEAGAAGIITFGTNYIPGFAILRKTPGGDQALRAAAANVAGRMMVAGAAESAQEMSEQVLTDAVVALIRQDPVTYNSEYFEKIGLAGIAGSILGGAARGGVELAGRGTVPPQPPAPTIQPSPQPLTPEQEAQIIPAQTPHVPKSTQPAIDVFQGVRATTTPAVPQEIPTAQVSPQVVPTQQAQTQTVEIPTLPPGFKLERPIAPSADEMVNVTVDEPQGVIGFVTKFGDVQSIVDHYPGAKILVRVGDNPVYQFHEYQPREAEPAVQSEAKTDEKRTVPTPAPQVESEPVQQAGGRKPRRAKAPQPIPEGETRIVKAQYERKILKLGESMPMSALETANEIISNVAMGQNEEYGEFSNRQYLSVDAFAVTPDTLSQYGKAAKMRAAKMGIKIVEDAEDVIELLGDTLYQAALEDAFGGRAGKLRNVIRNVLDAQQYFDPKDVLSAFILNRWNESVAIEEARRPTRPMVDPKTLKRGDTFNIMGEPFEVIERDGALHLASDALDATLPIDALESFPIERGSFESAPEAKAEQQPGTSGVQKNLLGQDFVEALTGKQQGLAFPEESKLSKETKAMAGKDVEGQTMFNAPSGNADAPAKGAFHQHPQITPGPARAKTITVQPVPMPELVALARELMGGKFPFVNKRLSSALGKFYGGGRGAIGIRPDLAKDPMQLASTLAHEIGHLIDYLPDRTLKRGNIIGRLKTLHSFLKQSFGSLSNKEIRKELLDLTEWWKPYKDAGAPDHYVKYRESAKELYADALSILLNAPNEMQARAPKFWDAFWSNIDRKPEVQNALLDLQDLLNGVPGEVLDTRRASIQEGFAKAEDKYRERRAEIAAAGQSAIAALRQYLADSSGDIIPRTRALVKKGVNKTDAMAARMALEELRYADNVNTLLLGRVEREIVAPLLDEHQISLTVAGEFLFYNRIIGGDRAEIINPYGFTPKEAQEGLDRLRDNIGSKKFNVLEQHIQAFHDIIYEVNERARDAGIISRKTFSEVIEPNKDHYASFAVVDYVTESIDPRIKQQIGTFKEIGNPFIFTLGKTMAMNRLIESQNAKREVTDWMRQFFPDEIKRQKGENQYIAEPDRALKRENLYMYDDGKAIAYEVPQWVANAFMGQDIGGLRKAANLLAKLSYRIFHPLFVKWNPGFWVFNFTMRDPLRTWKNMTSNKDISTREVLKAYWKAIPLATKRARGIHDLEIDEMLSAKAFDVPFLNYVPDQEHEMYDTMLERFGYKARSGISDKSWPVVRWTRELVEAINVFQESVPKIAGFRVYKSKGLSDRETAFKVRNYVGTPNYRQKGLAGELVNGLYMYYNVRIQGLRSDMELALRDDQSRSGWWMRTVIVDLMPKLAMRGAMLGLFGAGVKALFDAIPAYDLLNYIIIPIGWDDDDEGNRKAVYIRLAHADTGQLVAGLFGSFLNTLHQDDPLLDDMRNVAGYGIGHEAPSMSPLLTSAAKWGEYATGQNPKDTFYDRDIIRKDNFTVGGFPAFMDMVRWQMRQFGVASVPVYQFTKPEGEKSSTLEVVTQTVPGVNRLIKVSDKGIREKQWEAVKDEERIDAASRLAIPESVRWIVSERSRLMKVPDDQLREKDHEYLLRASAFYRIVYTPARKAMEAAIREGDDETQDIIRERLQEAADAFNE